MPIEWTQTEPTIHEVGKLPDEWLGLYRERHVIEIQFDADWWYGREHQPRETEGETP